MATENMIERILTAYLGDKVAATIETLDALARLQALEGAARVRPGAWVLSGSPTAIWAGLERARAKFPDADPDWFRTEPTGMYKYTVNAADRALRGNRTTDGRDLVQSMMFGISNITGNEITNGFREVGAKNYMRIESGAFSPIKAAKIVGNWAYKKALSEVNRQRKENLYEMGEEETIEDFDGEFSTDTESAVIRMEEERSRNLDMLNFIRSNKGSLQKVVDLVGDHYRQKADNHRVMRMRGTAPNPQRYLDVARMFYLEGKGLKEINAEMGGVMNRTLMEIQQLVKEWRANGLINDAAIRREDIAAVEDYLVSRIARSTLKKEASHFPGMNIYRHVLQSLEEGVSPDDEPVELDDLIRQIRVLHRKAGNLSSRDNQLATLITAACGDLIHCIVGTRVEGF